MLHLPRTQSDAYPYHLKRVIDNNCNNKMKGNIR